MPFCFSCPGEIVMPNLIGETVSHYAILDKLGEGGMGVVYKAEDTRLHRTVALKFLPHGLESHEPERARFLQEAQATSALNHPNVCTVYDIGSEGEQQFIVMEYVEGKTLREFVPVKKMQDAIAYAIQIAEALQEAHAHGIVHRDIKAENIMVNSKNQIKVMDFGLARLKGSLKLTKTSSTVGTLAYMAPEQIQGGEVDARSDIFSFGIVLYEMLTGRLPFRGEHDAAMLYSIVNDEPEPLQHYIPDAPSELLHILDRALEKDVEERYQTVHDMLIDLRRVKKDTSRVVRQLFDGTTPAPGAKAPDAAGKKRLLRRLLPGVAVVAVLVAISAVYFLSGPNRTHLNPNRVSTALRVPFKEIGVASLSRDGNWIAFPAKDERGRWDVYMMNVAGGKPFRVTYESAFFLETADLSPDVSQIVYDCVKELGAGATYKIKGIPSQGGAPQTLADSGCSPKWRPDGARIGYARDGSKLIPSTSGRFEVWSVKPDGSDSRRELIDTVARNAEDMIFPVSFCWSPDGNSMAWIRNYPDRFGEVMVRELASGRERQLTSDKKTVDEVIWSTNDEILFVSNKSGQSNLWMIPAAGGEAVQVTQGAVPISAPRISGDNKTLVYLQQEYAPRLWISSIDGSNVRPVTSAEINMAKGSFSPDGNHIAYVTSDVDASNVDEHLGVMDRDGRNQRQLTSGARLVRPMGWSSQGDWIAYASRGFGEPRDSDNIYLIQPFNQGTPRMVCRGTRARWIDGDSLLVGNLKYPLSGGPPIRVEDDSRFVYPRRGNGEFVFYDSHKGREGLWVAPNNPPGTREKNAKRIHPGSVPYFLNPPDLSFFIWRKGDEIWRVRTESGRQERIGKVIPGMAFMEDVSPDGKEILWGVLSQPSRVVLVKNVFE